LNDKDLDYALVALKSPSLPSDGQGTVPLNRFGFNRLSAEEGKVQEAETVNIIQHPNGAVKQLAVQDNDVTKRFPNFVQYHTDTMPGSSGAPVFNNQWEVIALHHSGVPGVFEDGPNKGKYKASDGQVWQEWMGDDKIEWIANEGVRISRVMAHVQERLGGLTPAQQAAAQALLKAVPPGEPAGPSPDSVAPVTSSPRTDGEAQPPRFTTARHDEVPGVAQADSPEIASDVSGGAVRVTIPLTITVRLGGPAPASAGSSLPPTGGGTVTPATHKSKLPYAPAAQLYPWVDRQPDGGIHSLYTGEEFDVPTLIREAFRAEETLRRREEALRRQESLATEERALQLEALEAQLAFNCEHVVPQSWFGKRLPMRGDLHHLFACETKCNSFRGNTPYFDFTDFEERVMQDCGRNDGDKFEPKLGKAAAARATLYFLLGYPGQVNPHEMPPSRLPIILRWAKSEEPSPYERHRNAAIFAVQGNRNPLIDNPEWLERIAFERGIF
jgi:endonuclease G